MHIAIKSDPNLDAGAAFEKFKRDNGVHYVLAFSGGADDNHALVEHVKIQLREQMSEESAALAVKAVELASDSLVQSIISAILMPLRGYQIAILSGGTKWGVPRIAAQTAKSLGFKTIGVYPLTAELKKQCLSSEILDFSICVHPHVGESRWGDESPVFTRCLDGVIIIGGGAGTMIEVSHLLKRNERTDSPVKHIVPIIGTGGTADQVMSFPGKPLTMSRCLPPKPITDGANASIFLRHHVFHEDMFEHKE